MPRPPARLAAPSRGDDVVAQASEVVGGPVGRYAAIGRRPWTYAGALLSALASVVVALGVLQKNHCVRSGWSTPGSLWRACYSDLPAAVTPEHGATPWSGGGPGHSQPVLTAFLTWVLRWLTPSGSGLAEQRWYFALGAVVIALLVAVTVVATAGVARSTPWLAAHVALSPVLVTAALVSFDMFGVALMALGLLAWSRRHSTSAGVLLGAATMARTFPAVVLVAVALVAWRDDRRRELRHVLAGAALAVVLSLVLAWSMGGDPLASYQLWTDQGAGYGSPWLVAQIAHVSIPAAALTALAVIGWLLALVVGVYLATDRERAFGIPQLSLVMLVIVMVTGKTIPVQAALWVLPLIALCGLRWRDHLIWAAVEVTYFAGVWMYAGTSFNADRALPAPAYALLTSVRLLAYVGLAWRCLAGQRELDDARAEGPAASPGAARTRFAGVAD
ncbi:glycosyltransferase 87 family protein [Luteipulveratus sp. YIM 133132]|uniref:Glycosyltransferase 87 family protein n=1 Tax=Luteipulveratus flavus TaxID=3031728 RepID=A0ABT6C6A4_9MICO|nr:MULTISPECIES: glycosyltransferase 87 family protein [unclassified Luteipulveratus]MDE9365347.1 glycosyltransferase 87 family protein [Luteipulveratus sp. YIM 133132]MDF8263847.1 glycosyltransferase 87 family protein [Luteipulveratus sp. YIM 133296]